MRSIYSFEIYIVRFEESNGAKILKEIMIILNWYVKWSEKRIEEIECISKSILLLEYFETKVLFLINLIEIEEDID